MPGCIQQRTVSSTSRQLTFPCPTNSHSPAHSPTRRDALSTTATAALALFVQTKSADAAGLAMGYGVSEKAVNEQLVAYGLPQMDKIPSGFRPLIMPVGGTVGANIDGGLPLARVTFTYMCTYKKTYVGSQP